MSGAWRCWGHRGASVLRRPSGAEANRLEQAREQYVRSLLARAGLSRRPGQYVDDATILGAYVRLWAVGGD